jgi:hypothetical protein
MLDPRDARRGTNARLALALTLSALVAALAVLRGGPPPLVPADAPPDVGSGARALEVLGRLAGDGAPRPVASAANAAARERLVQELTRLGLEVEVQATFAVRDDGGAVCGAVQNVVARRRGRAIVSPMGVRHSLLCMAHYDSVGAGPGVSDDLAGVAAWLEVARALRASDDPLRRDLIFLFSDAEEHGLLGAEAFAAQHRWFGEVGAVINLEARGTSGASRMFETGADNDWIAAAFARGASRPSTTSLSTEIYRRMPNDTDYSVFRRRGIPGLNFAWIGGVSRYHTPLDDLVHLDARSLQHHVTNALDAVRALDAAPWRPPGQGRGDAVFADVLGWRVALIGEDLARALALGALLLALIGVVRVSRVGVASGGRVIAGAFGVVALAALVTLFVHTTGILLEAAAGVARPWRAHPLPAVLGLLGGGLAASVLLAPLAARAATVAGVGLGTAVVLGASALLLALFVPGASVLVLVPALAAGIGVACTRYVGDGAHNVGRIALTASVLSLFVLAPLGAALVDAYGLAPPFVHGPSLGAALGSVIGLWALTLAPVLAAVGGPMRFATAALGLVAVGFAAAMAAFLPATSVEAPGHLSLVYASDHGTRVAEWHLVSSGDPVPAELLARGTFGPPRVRPSWSLRNVGAAPAPEGLLAFPELRDVTVTETPDGRVVSGRLFSLAGGHQFDVQTIGVQALEVEGTSVPHRVRLLGVPEDGIRLRALLVAPEDSDVVPALEIVERVFRALPESQHLAAARPAQIVPSGHGDGAQLMRRIGLDPARPLVTEPKREPAPTAEGAR